MSLGVLILMMIVGIGFVIAEVFFVSMGILSVLASACLIGAIFLAYTQHDETTGHIFLGITALAVPSSILYSLRALPNTKIGRLLLLSGPARESVSKAAEEPGIGELLNKTGVAESMLRPSGVARIDGRRIHVVTRGEMIECGATLEVIQVAGNQVVVKERPAVADLA